MYDGGSIDETRFDGGAEEDTLAIDPNHVYIDMDEAEALGEYQQMACTRLKRVPDWSLRHATWMGGYCAKELRPNDYYFINSMLVAFLSLVALTLALTARWKDSYGLMVGVPILYLGLMLLVASSVVAQSRAFSGTEIIVWVLAQLGYGALGVLFFAAKFDLSDFEFTLSQERSAKMIEAAYFILFFILLVPTFIAGLTVALTVADRGSGEKLPAFLKALAAEFALGVILMLACAFLFVHWIDGAIAVACVLALVYGAVQLRLYFQNDFFIKPVWRAVNLVLLFLGVIAAAAESAWDDNLSSYAGLSYSALVLLVVWWAYALLQFGIDLLTMESRPVFYSDSLFPIYKYNPKLLNVEEHYSPTIAWAMGLALALLWGFCSTFAVVPSWFGVVFTIGMQLLLGLSVLYLTSLTKSSMLAITDFIDPGTVKKAWIETKRTYIQQKGAFSRHELLSYRALWCQRHYLDNLIAAVQGRALASPYPEDVELHRDFEAAQSDPKAFYRQKVQQFIPNDFQVDSIADLCTLSFQKSTEVHEAYVEELEQIIQFTMIAVQTVAHEQA